MKNTTLNEQRKALSLQRLADRYYGKKDLLASWEQSRAEMDPDYRRDLQRRLHSHYNDLMYRGVSPEEIE